MRCHNQSGQDQREAAGAIGFNEVKFSARGSYLAFSGKLSRAATSASNIDPPFQGPNWSLLK